MFAAFNDIFLNKKDCSLIYVTFSDIKRVRYTETGFIFYDFIALLCFTHKTLLKHILYKDMSCFTHKTLLKHILYKDMSGIGFQFFHRNSPTNLLVII